MERVYYDFEPLAWNKSLAYNTFDGTIRREATDNIPWSGEKWNTTNCCTRKSGTQIQVWDKDKKELVWVKTPDIVYFGGLSPDEQEALVPIVARGLTARLIRAARRNSRGKWLIENEAEVCERYRKSKEDGVPFDKEELAEHFSDELKYFYDYSQNLSLVIDNDLYELVADCIGRYTGRTKSAVMQDDDLADCFDTRDSYNQLMEFIESKSNPPTAYMVGKAIKRDLWQKHNKVTNAEFLRRLSLHYYPDNIEFYNHDNTK